MRKHLILIIGLISVSFVAPTASALTLGLDNLVGSFSPASAANTDSAATEAANELVSWYNDSSAPAPVVSGITFTLNDSGPSPLLPSLAFGLREDSGTWNPIDTSVYSYALGKYGNTAYLFYIGNLDGVVDLPAEYGSGRNGNPLSLSHEILFTPPNHSVADNGTTLLLLGFGLTGLVLVRRRFAA